MRGCSVLKCRAKRLLQRWRLAGHHVKNCCLSPIIKDGLQYSLYGIASEIRLSECHFYTAFPPAGHLRCRFIDQAQSRLQSGLDPNTPVRVLVLGSWRISSLNLSTNHLLGAGKCPSWRSPRLLSIITRLLDFSMIAFLHHRGDYGPIVSQITF